MKNNLKYLAVINNRSNEQMEFLFTLCDNRFFVLVELLAKMKENNSYQVPGTVAERNNLLSLTLKEDEEHLVTNAYTEQVKKYKKNNFYYEK